MQAAQKYRDKGVTLNLTYEAGLQALEPKNFSGPLWQALTGINFNVVELPHPDQYSKPIAEHIANSGAYDVLDIEPAWIPALANGGAIVPIDDYIDKFMNKADLDDYHPLYKSITLYKGKRWGVFDDGDQFALYYRTDIFGDPKLKSAYQAKFGKPFGRAEDLGRILAGRAIHHRSAGAERLWRRAFPQVRQSRQPVQLPAAVPRQRRQVLRRGHEGAIDRRGRRHHARTDDRAEQGVVAGQQRPRRRGAMGGLAAGQGGDDILVAADRAHVVELRPARQSDQLHPAVEHRRQGRLRGVPGGNGEMASGYVRALAAGSNNEEAAYLFMQWVTAPPFSLVRTMLPYTLRDPYRLSTYKSEEYRALWPAAKDYLSNLCECSNSAVVDMIMPGWQDYALSIDRMCSAVWGGADPKASLQKAAAEWDTATQRLGVAAQKAAYQEFLQDPRLLRRSHDREGRPGGARRLTAAAVRPRARHGARAIASARCAVAATGDLAIHQPRKCVWLDLAAQRASGPHAHDGSRISAWAERHFKWLMVAPAVLLILAFSIYPLLFSLWVDFVNYDFQIPGHDFVGLQNSPRSSTIRSRGRRSD